MRDSRLGYRAQQNLQLPETYRYGRSRARDRVGAIRSGDRFGWTRTAYQKFRHFFATRHCGSFRSRHHCATRGSQPRKRKTDYSAVRPHRLRKQPSPLFHFTMTAAAVPRVKYVPCTCSIPLSLSLTRATLHTWKPGQQAYTCKNIISP